VGQAAQAPAERASGRIEQTPPGMWYRACFQLTIALFHKAGWICPGSVLHGPKNAVSTDVLNGLINDE
jgi:hypothetical protein